MSWRLPPRSRRWRWCLPELASRGATPAWRASWASEGKRSIGPISQSSLAALSGPQPGSSSSRGASACVVLGARGRAQRSSGSGVRQRPRRSRAIRTWVVCSRRASWRPSRSIQTARSSAPSGTVAPGRARAGASAAVAGSDAARRPGRRGDRPAASTPATSPRRRVGRRVPALAAQPVRPRARRSRPTYRASGRADAAAPSTAVAPAPAARPRQKRLLEAACDMPAVLNCPEPLLAEHACPGQHLAVDRPSSAPQPARPSSSTATAVNECLCTSTPITIIRLASNDKGGDRRADRPQSRRKPRSYQVTLDGLGKAAATQHWQVGREPTIGNRVSRRQPESQTRTRQHQPK